MKFGCKILIFIVLLAVLRIADIFPRNSNATIEIFLNYWFKGNIDRAIPYISEDSKQYAYWIKQTRTENEIKKMRDVHVKVEKIEYIYVDDSTKMCICEIMIDTVQKNIDLSLSKKSGKWYINLIR